MEAHNVTTLERLEGRGAARLRCRGLVSAGSPSMTTTRYHGLGHDPCLEIKVVSPYPERPT
jgi:hypothetical protein